MSNPSPQSSELSASERFREQTVASRSAVWLKGGRRLKARVNVAWWLHYFLPFWVAVAVLGGVGVLVVRNHWPDVGWQVPMIVCGGLVVVAGIVAWRRAQARFIDDGRALARLDEGHGLNNALSTAFAGVGQWPESGGRDNLSELPLRWRGGRVTALTLVPALVLAMACWLPVEAAVDDPETTHRPAVWDKIDQLLADRVLDELADPERIEALQREMEKLGDRPAGDWFDHASLETSDRIDQLLDAGLENMEQNLSRAGNLVPRLADALGDHIDPLDDEAREKLARQMQQAVEQLQNQPLGLDPKIAEKLMQAAPDALRNMDPQQAQQLADQLREWAEKAGEKRNGQGQGGKPLWQQLLEQDQEGGQPGEGGDQPGDQPGDGGIARGPGDAPMSLKNDQSMLEGMRDELLDGNGEMQPGEKLGETSENREVERVEIGPRAGGSAASEGSGGDRVWRQSLTPAEQNLLENYFK